MWPFTALRRRRLQNEEIITALLWQHGELSGYELGRLTGRGVAPLYSTLDRMERAGKLKSRWGAATAIRGWRRPRLYSLNVAPPDATEFAAAFKDNPYVWSGSTTVHKGTRNE